MAVKKNENWQPLSEDVVAYETSVECAYKLQLAHTLLTEVVSDLRHFDNFGGDELFDSLGPLPREVGKAQQRMVDIYRELRKTE